MQLRQIKCYCYRKHSAAYTLKHHKIDQKLFVSTQLSHGNVTLIGIKALRVGDKFSKKNLSIIINSYGVFKYTVGKGKFRSTYDMI